MNCPEIEKDIKKILDERGLPPNIVSINQSLQNDLGGKRFSDLSDEKRKTIYGDITILNEDAFHYYLFEIIEDVLNRESLPPLFDMFLLGLSKSSMSFDRRLDKLTPKEKNLVLKFLECVMKYITTSTNSDAINLMEDNLQDIKEIIEFWKSKV